MNSNETFRFSTFYSCADIIASREGLNFWGKNLSKAISLKVHWVYIYGTIFIYDVFRDMFDFPSV